MKKLALILLACVTIGHAWAQGPNVMVVNPTTRPVPVTITGGAAATTTKETGTANIATSQVTASGTAGTVAIARSTRRQCTLKNIDATNTATVGPATVTTGNGMPLKAGESITVRSVGLIQVIANAGSPIIAVMDEYD